MNLKNNKGFTGIDISVAVIVILIFIPTVFGIVYNMQKTRVKTERQTEAVDVATNILEIAKTTPYNQVNAVQNSGLYAKILENSSYTYNSTNSSFSYVGKNDVHYKVEIDITNEPQNLGNELEDLIKKIKVTVTYPIGNEFKTIEISTLIQNKNI